MKYLTKRYTEPHRKYHTLTHVANMFYFATMNGIHLTYSQTIAVWFHDAVYVPGSLTNEEDSVKVFEDWTKINLLHSYQIEKIKTIILDTKNEIPTIEDSKIVIDLDLSRLGTDKFEIDKQLIKEEFVPDFCTEEEFIKGRIKWLKKFLQRDTIYVSKIYPFFDNEKIARKNLQNELNEYNVENND